MRWPWVSRRAYDAVCEERDRLVEERKDLLIHTLNALVAKAEEATGRRAVSVEMERVGKEVFMPTVHLEPPLSPEIESRIDGIADRDLGLKSEIRTRALKMKRSGMDDEDVLERMLDGFRVEV